MILRFGLSCALLCPVEKRRSDDEVNVNVSRSIEGVEMVVQIES